MSSFSARFKADRKGATAIEYGLMAALLALALVAALAELGPSIRDGYGVVGDIFAQINGS